MIIKNLLYIFQIENYNLINFLRFAYSHFKWWNLEKRNGLIWTLKAKLIYILSIGLILGIILVAYLVFGYWGLLSAVILIPFTPLVILLAFVALMPFDFYLKGKLIKRARIIVETYKGRLIVVGITGSYGKTSEREILTAILKEKFKVVAPTGNINTDVGLANFIIENKKELAEADVFVVEMGAFKKGEIKKICDIVTPDYGIITGITESHLEKFGSLENIISAKFELAQAVGKSVVLNFDDENIKNNYGRFEIKDFVGVSQNNAQNVMALDNYGGVEFEVAAFGEPHLQREGIKLHTKLLALHNVSLILLAIEIGKKLEVSMGQIAKGIEKIDYVEHRLQPIYNPNTNIWVIDDSYNGNFNGFVSGIEVLSRAKGRKVVLTPGLVELGEKTKEIHNKIGQLYADERVDLVLLIKNKAAQYIVESLRTVNYKIYNSTQEAHEDLVNVLKNGDTIIFQNDWPDNYF